MGGIPGNGRPPMPVQANGQTEAKLAETVTEVNITGIPTASGQMVVLEVHTATMTKRVAFHADAAKKVGDAMKMAASGLSVG